MRDGRVRLLVAMGVVLFGASVARAADVIPARVAEGAKARVDAHLYPALVVAVVDDGKTEVAGYGALPDGKAPGADTIFEIGSVTKTFTATLLADAVISGRVTLDEPLAKLLPDFTIPSRDGKSITLAESGTQHSGLPRMPANFAPADPSDPYADYDAARLKAFLADYELPRDPGASYEYSNLAFGLLGYALAHSADTDYPTLLHDRVLAPLGMASTGTTLTGAMRAHLAPPHDEAGKLGHTWRFDVLAGCGAIKSDATDMLRYLRANMGALKTPLADAMKLAHTPRADMGETQRIGLAWMTHPGPGGGIVWHNGMTGGYASFVGFTADSKRGVVVLTNAAVSVDDLGMSALDPDAPLAAAHPTIAMSHAQLDAYAGTYEIAQGFDLRIFRAEQQLYGQATGQQGFALYPSADDEFVARLAPIGITFERDADGKVTGLVLHQNGDHPARRKADAPSIALDAAALQDYVGQYQLAPGAIFDITTQGDQLYAQLTGQPSFPVFASAKDRFFYKVVDAQIDFVRGEDGKVEALVLHQNGKDLRAPRTK